MKPKSLQWWILLFLCFGFVMLLFLAQIIVLFFLGFGMLFSAGAAPGYNFTPWVIVPILVFLSPGLLASFLLIQGYAWFSKALISNKLKIVRNTFGLLAAVGISVFTWWLFHIQDVGK